MLSKESCAKGPIPAAGLARAGDLSQEAGCILFWHMARAGLGKGLSQPLQVPGEGADLFGDQLCCLCTSCKDRPQAGISPAATHFSPGPAPSARGIAWAVPSLSPLLASLLRPATVQGMGTEGWGSGTEGWGEVPSTCWWLVGGDRQGSASPGSLHGWSPSTLGSEVWLAQHFIPMCSAAPGGGAGPPP